MTNYISVTEYAEKYKKDPGNIRRMLIEGRMQGVKIGRQWAIDENEPYPEDRRVKSGQYAGWRKRAAYYKAACIKSQLEPLVKDLVDIYGESLESIILYGSYARGTQTEESDVDIALLIKDDSNIANEDRMIDCVAKYELEYSKVLSVVDIEAQKFHELEDILPYYKNILKEGIVLWTAA